ncbi:hypothetical protein PHOSAC3_140012 [Mesotoga infera]|nr:hypothetical protein PHOSAC3_140012 [Mesotoga infera]
MTVSKYLDALDGARRTVIVDLRRPPSESSLRLIFYDSLTSASHE